MPALSSDFIHCSYIVLSLTFFFLTSYCHRIQSYPLNRYFVRASCTHKIPQYAHVGNILPFSLTVRRQFKAEAAQQQATVPVCGSITRRCARAQSAGGGRQWCDTWTVFRIRRVSAKTDFRFERVHPRAAPGIQADCGRTTRTTTILLREEAELSRVKHDADL